MGFEEIAEMGDESSGDGNVALLHLDAHRFGESLNDRKQGVGGQHRRLVRLRVDDLAGGDGGEAEMTSLPMSERLLLLLSLSDRDTATHDALADGAQHDLEDRARCKKGGSESLLTIPFHPRLIFPLVFHGATAKRAMLGVFLPIRKNEMKYLRGV